MDQETKQSLFQSDWKNPRLRFLSQTLLLLQCCWNNEEDRSVQSYAFFQSAWNILKSRAMRQVLTYLFTNGAASSQVLQQRTGLSPSTVYYILKRFQRLEILEPERRVKTPANRRVTIHALQGCDPETFQNAARLHVRLSHPKYRIAEENAQLILDEYISHKPTPEITYNEILAQLRQIRTSYVLSDLAQLTAQCLTEKGVRVWR